VVGDGDPGVAETVRGGGIEAVIADEQRNCGLCPGGERNRRLKDTPVRCAAAGGGRHDIDVDADCIRVCALIGDNDAAAVSGSYAGREADALRHTADARKPSVVASGVGCRGGRRR